MKTVYSGFRAGIQRGTVAFGKEAKRLDTCVSLGARKLSETNTDFAHRRNLNGTRYLPQGSAGVQPDGGLWEREGKIVAAFEAKYQGDKGNAIERWYKNQYVMRMLVNTDTTYITFITGATGERDPMRKILLAAHTDDRGKVMTLADGGDSISVGKNNLVICDGYDEHAVEKFMGDALDAIVQQEGGAE